MPPSTIIHLGNIVAVLRRSPASVEHHRRHHAIVLTELIYYLDNLLDQEGEVRQGAERVQNSKVTYVRYLDRSDQEDVQLLPLHCVNASVSGLRGYVDNTLPSRCYASP